MEEIIQASNSKSLLSFLTVPESLFLYVWVEGRGYLTGTTIEVVHRPTAFKQGKWNERKIKQDLEEWETGE